MILGGGFFGLPRSRGLRHLGNGSRISGSAGNGPATREFRLRSLLDTNGRPTEVFSRMADAFFFWVDANCDVPGLRGTGVIEPAKYVWMTARMGASPQAVRTSPFSHSRY